MLDSVSFLHILLLILYHYVFKNELKTHIASNSIIYRAFANIKEKKIEGKPSIFPRVTDAYKAQINSLCYYGKDYVV